MKLQDVKQYPAAHAGVFCIVGTFAAASTTGAVILVSTFSLPAMAMVPAMILAGIVAASVAVMPVLIAPAWANARGFAKVTGLALAVTFCTFDAALQTSAVATFNRVANTAAITQAQTRLDVAQAALANVPDPSATGQIRNRDTWQLVIDRRTAERDEAAQALSAAQAVEIPILLIAGVMAMFQAATFFSRAWLTSVTERQKAAIRMARAAQRRRRRVKAKPQPAHRRPALVSSN